MGILIALSILPLALLALLPCILSRDTVAGPGEGVLVLNFLAVASFPFSPAVGGTLWLLALLIALSE